ncbi:hypothetical protein CL654_01370 [bacterium]|nr:hypothetical protein [bacterium]|tara:strand:- start:15058 stop:15495 length:438 start_codon:yes stop_codon:yes gene_type:complete
MAKKVELKTKKNKASVSGFLNKIKDPEKKKDAKKIVSIMKEVTKEKPTMWGSSIVGFGNYHFKYASGREGDWMITGFSPRSQNLTVYIMPGYSFPEYKALLKKLGPHKLGKSCLYIKRLDDIHIPTLKKLIARGYKDMKTEYKQK